MWKSLLLLALLAAVLPLVYRMGVFLGFHRTVFLHQPGPCKVLKNINRGSEDIHLISGNKALITSGLRAFHHGNPHYAGVKGKLFMFDFNNPQADAQEVTIKNFKHLDTFDPHGMSVWEDKTDSAGKVVVFVVNHASDPSVIEIFTYNAEENSVYHEETVSDPHFKTLNDVLAVGPRQFYCTRAMYYRSSLEPLLQLHWGAVIYYDGHQGRVATKEGMMYTNGINISPDGRYIYVATFFHGDFRVYHRNSDNSLELKQIYPLYTNPDNIHVDGETGHVWLGCHPKPISMIQHLEDPLNIPGDSQVLYLQMDDGQVTDIQEVLKDDGTLISASSTAVYVNHQILVGSIGSKCILCDVKYLKS